MDTNLIGITERGDASLSLDWIPWVSQGKPAILITKDPEKLYQILSVFKPLPNIIVHTTITGLGGSMFEPNVPYWNTSLDAYNKLIDLLDQSRIVLRIDPIIPTEDGIETAKQVLDIASKNGLKTRVRISFVDNYEHVKQRLKDLKMLQFPWEDFHAPFGLRKWIWEEFGKPEICGEPGFDCIGCVSNKDCEILGVQPLGKGHQRQACHCLANKIELLSNKKQCLHKCVYCYWR